MGVFFKADGDADAFYLRFTSSKQNSLILGTSRAAQGIIPDILNKELNRNDLFNYSFTLGHSPYGPTYLNSVKRKLDKSFKNGIFIITVDPWSISSITFNPNDSLNFREVNRSLGKVSLVNYHPNLEYLILDYSNQYLNLLRKPTEKYTLHKNGWLEVNVDMDSIKVAERVKRKLKIYQTENLTNYKFSDYRYNYLGKTISYLQDYGKVYLVRLPISPEIFEIEKSLIFDFDIKMRKLSETYEIPYFNLTDENSNFQYTDGNHLHKESGKEVSRLISELILESNY